MLVVFDWDGTLIDSMQKIVSCVQKAAKIVDLPVLDALAIKNIIGLGLPEAVLTLYPDADLSLRQALCKTYSQVYVEQDKTPCALYPGVEQGLLRLLNAGHYIAVATGKSRQGLNRVLESLAWQDKFHATRCADETASKPHPLMLHELMAELNMDKSEVIMVGDTEYDLAMAKNAGVRSVGVSYGAHSPQRLFLHQPLAVIDAFEQLEQLV